MSNQYSGRQSENRQRSNEQSARKVQAARDALPNSRRDAEPNKHGQGGRVGSGLHNRSHVKDLLDTQLGSGADIIGQLGSSAKRAAEDLEQNAPQLAGLVRGVADRIEGYADDLRDQSVDERFPVGVEFHASPASSRIWTCCARRLFCSAHAEEQCASTPAVAWQGAVIHGRTPWRMSN